MTGIKRSWFFVKDELNSIPLEEFIGLRAKCYSLKFTGKVKNNVFQHHDRVEKATAAGTKKSLKENHLRHEHYLKTLKTQKKQYVTQNAIMLKNRHESR